MRALLVACRVLGIEYDTQPNVLNAFEHET